MIKPTSPLKTCANCGQQKPLSAFLQITGKETGYGNICATCRKTLKDKVSKEREDSSTSHTGHKIDSKAKVQAEIDKRQQRKEKEDLYHKEREKNEIRQSEKWEKMDSTAQDAKKYRAKTSFLNSSPKTKTVTSTPLPGSEEQIAKESQFDFSAPVLDAGSGKEKYKSARYNQLRHQFKLWLGASAPNSTEQAKQNAEAEEQESLAEFAKKIWGK